MAQRAYTNSTDKVQVVYTYSFEPKTVNPGQTITWDDLGFELPIYANNAAAIAGGLAAGDFYQDGGNPSHICVVY